MILSLNVMFNTGIAFLWIEGLPFGRFQRKYIVLKSY